MITQSIALLSFSIALTYLGASKTLKGALGLSTFINLGKSATGAVIVASVTALPELTSSLTAIFLGSTGLALGNILGSNIYNLPLLIGLAGLVGEFEITNHVAEQCVFLVATNIFIATVTLVLGTVPPVMSMILLSIYIAFLWRQLHKGGSCEAETCNLHEATLTLFIGGGALILGSVLLVNNAIRIMNAYSLSPFMVGIMMSLGAVLPEVAVSLLSAVKGEHEISIGNIIGDNIITATLVLGLVSALSRVNVAPSEVLTTIPFTIGFTAVLYLMHIKGWKVTRLTALLFLIATAAILGMQIMFA